MKRYFDIDEAEERTFSMLPMRQWSPEADWPRGDRERSGQSLPEPRTDSKVQRAFLATDPLAVRKCEVIQTNLWLSYPEGRMKKVTTFVGATAGCGVSTVAANFAGALAQDATARILLIVFGARGAPRVAEQRELDLRRWLDEKCHPALPSSNAPPNVYLLSSESLGAAVASVLQSQAFDEFLARARERFDHVVIDAPALHHPESLILCRKADGVVLVVRAGRTRNHAAVWARQQIDNARCNLAGVVLNRRKYYIPRWLYRLL